MSYRLFSNPHCPTPKRQLEAATHDTFPSAAIKPKPGDFSVCFYCGAYLRFDDALCMKAISDAELQGYPHPVQQQLKRMSDVIKQRRQVQ